MKNLKDTISESISSGRYVNLFPDIPDKELIIRWLDRNGYDFVRKYVSADEALFDHKNRTGNNCYDIGRYDSCYTKWIRILKGDKLYFIRTVGDEFYIDDLEKKGNKLVYSNPSKRSPMVPYKDIVDSMNLPEYMSEAISSRGNSPYNYTPFPAKRTDHEGIIEWLEENGFTKLNGFTVEQLVGHHRETGEKCYQSGKKLRDKATHWIRFYDGNMVIFIRTCDMSYLLNHRDLRICTMKYPEDDSGGEVSYEEIVKYFK